MPEMVRITDVSPRDGLQNEAGVIPTADKVRLIQLLRRCGVDEVEVTSFVSPKWVPQLGDASDVLAAINTQDRARPPVQTVLLPNAKGMAMALESAVFDAIDKVAVFTAASETFSKRNTNATIAETIERFRPVVEQAHASGLEVRGYISCIFACPFEGPIEPRAVVDLAAKLIELGVDEIDLGDTIGAGTPASTRTLLGAYAALGRADIPLTLHLHDTFGKAAACVAAALEAGVRSFDGSAAGLGGCPYASTPEKRAPGNISTELLVRTVHDAGYSTNVNMEKLAEASAWASQIVARSRSGAGA